MLIDSLVVCFHVYFDHLGNLTLDEHLTGYPLVLE